MFPRILSVLGAWSCLTVTTVLAAGSPAPDAAAGQALAPSRFAGWSARGVDVSGSMTALWIGDVAGGRTRGGVYNTLGFANAAADLGRLTGWWHGGRAFVNGAWIRGGSVSARYVGDALVVSNLDGFDSIRLYEAWLEQSFASGTGSVRAGVLAADEEFSGTEGGAMLTNSAFGWEAGIGANVVNGGPIYFAPGLGLRVQAPPVAGWTVRAGAYDGDSFDSRDGSPDPDQHGLHFQLSRAQGAFLVGSASRAWTGGAARTGRVELGAWRHTADFEDLGPEAAREGVEPHGTNPVIHHGNDGAYAVLEQALWHEGHDPAQGIGGWLRAAAAEPDRSPFAWVGEAGLSWTGLVPGRDADALGAGVVTAWVSPEARRLVRAQNAVDGGHRVVPDFERVIEVAYRVRAGEHWSVTPDLQWVQHPGTTRELPDAWVAGLRVTRQ